MKFSRLADALIVVPLMALSVLILMPNPHNLYASEATTDIPGSSDLDVLQRYPRSHIIAFENSAGAVPYTLILGSLKKIRNVLSPKKSRRVDGKVTRITYRIPDRIRSEDVFEHFKAQFAERGEILFACQQRDCGSSEYWANSIFHRADLYGPDEHQFLLVGRFMVSGQQILVTVYTIQRGNRRVYAHLEVVEAQLRAGMDAATMLELLMSDGILHLEGIRFDQHNRLVDNPQVINNLIELLNINSALEVYIVGHGGREKELGASMKLSAQRAEQLRSRLVQSGIAADRLSAQGIGPLGPVKGMSDNLIDLVLQQP